MGNFIKDFLGKTLDNKTDKSKSLNKENKSIKSPNIIKTENKTKSINHISYKKTILWIFIQIIVGMIFIVFSYSYLEKHEPEKKFFNSSIKYWKNIAINLYGKLGGGFAEQVDKNYIEKRLNMVKTLGNLSNKLRICIKKEQNKTTLKELEKTKKNIEGFKRLLSNTNYLSLKKYEEKYQHYSLWIHAMKESVENYCDK